MTQPTTQKSNDTVTVQLCDPAQLLETMIREINELVTGFEQEHGAKSFSKIYTGNGNVVLSLSEIQERILNPKDEKSLPEKVCKLCKS